MASRDLSSSLAPARGAAGSSRPSPRPSAPPWDEGNDHGRDPGRCRAPPRASDTQGALAPRLRGLCRSASFLRLLRALFPGRGLGRLGVCQSPAGPWHTGAAPHGRQARLCRDLPRARLQGGAREPAPSTFAHVSRAHPSSVLRPRRSPQSRQAQRPRPRGAGGSGCQGQRWCHVGSWAAAGQPSRKNQASVSNSA